MAPPISSLRRGTAALTFGLAAACLAAPPGQGPETDRYNPELDRTLAKQLRAKNFDASEANAPDDERLWRVGKVLAQVSTGVIPHMQGWSRTEVSCSLARASEMEATHIGHTNKTLARTAFELATEAVILKKKLGCVSDPGDSDTYDDDAQLSSYKPTHDLLG